MNKIIDAHTHYYPESVFSDPIAWANQNHEPHWASLVGPKSIQGWADISTMLKAMDDARVEKAVLLGWYWQHQSSCTEQNEWYARCLKEAPDRFLAFAAVQPAAGTRGFDEVRRRIDGGFVGIGEMLPQVQGFEITSHPVWFDVCQWAETHGVPINIHVTEPAGHKYKGKVETPLQSYIDLAELFPDLKLILAHWGGGLPFYAMNPHCASKMKNVWFDTAASPLIYSSKIWRAVIDMVGADRILFGTDYPLKLHPAKSKVPAIKCLVDEVLEAGLKEEEQMQIFRGTAENLFDL
jgi:hypothetical protein